MAVLLLVLAGMAIAVALSGQAAAAEDSEDPEFGPRAWEIGMEWAWDNGSATQETAVHDHKELATRDGRYQVWMTRSHRNLEDGSQHMRVTAWTEGAHRRAYDEVHIYRSGQDPLTVTTSYSPPAAFPIWETIGPGASWAKEVKTVTSYMVGTTPAGQETHTWKWAAWADNHVYNLTTPAGTYEGFNVTVYKEEVNGSDASRYRYFYAHEARHFVATFDSDENVDFELTDVVLKPPPNARGFTVPTIATVGENITLYGFRSSARSGEIDTIEWVLPNGTVLPGPNATTRFDDAGVKKVKLRVSDTTGQVSTVPLSIRVIERTPNFKIAGPSHATVEEGTSFRLIPPGDREVRRATWHARNVPTQSGTQAEMVFPEAGSYNITVTFVDSEGTTGRVHHKVRVVEGSGQAAGNGTAANGALRESAQSLVPQILSPENNTRLDQKQALIVARTTELDDPALVLGNGLRVSLDDQGNIASAQVPLSGDTTRIELVDGHRIIDAVTLLRGSSDVSTNGGSDDGSPGTNSVPFPWLAPLLVIPLLRRRER